MRTISAVVKSRAAAGGVFGAAPAAGAGAALGGRYPSGGFFSSQAATSVITRKIAAEICIVPCQP